MTLETTVSKAVYTGNGATTEFPFSFKVWDEDQILVSVTDAQGYVQEAGEYSVTLSAGGGTVSYLHEGAPLPMGWKLALTRDMPFTQEDDYITGTRFDPEVIETALDKATAERQQLREQLQRAVILPPTSDETPEDMAQELLRARDEAVQSAGAAKNSEQAAADSASDAAASEQAAAESVRQAEDWTERAQAWAESPTPPDPDDPESKSAKEWAKIASDTVPIATPALAGKVMPQTGDEDGLELGEDGSLRVRKATATLRGSVLASVTATAGAVPVAGDNGRLDDSWVAATLLNTRVVITESNASWTPPVTGWARVTVIGGGGGGGKGGGYAVGGSGGNQGGSTSFGNLTAAGGSGGGGGNASAGGGGGESGEIKTEFIRLNASPIKIVIGAGGAGGSVTQSGFPGTAGKGPRGGGVCSIGTQGGGGAPGAGNGNNHISTPEAVRSSGVGGSGAVTKTGYGGGGGGGAGGIELSHTTSGGAATDSATSGDSSSSNDGGTGGAGGQGAVILEYYDPNKEDA